MDWYAFGALDSGQAHLVLDLSGVDYVSSAALGALQTIAGRASAHGGKAVLCGIVALLFVRRSLAMRQPSSRYRALEIATLVATALGVGALMGLGAYLIMSGMGR